MQTDLSLLPSGFKRYAYSIPAGTQKHINSLETPIYKALQPYSFFI